MAQTFYVVAYLASATDPADDATGHAQIKNGQDGSGAAAAWSGNAAWSGPSTFVDTSGLTEGTLYATAAVVYDDVLASYSNRVLATETYTTVDIAASGALAVTGTLTPTGDIGFGINLAASGALAVTGSLVATGDIQIVTAALDIVASPLAVAGTVTPTGDTQIGTSFDLAASGALAVSGTVAQTGDIQTSSAPVLDIVASALAVSGAVTTTGGIQLGTSFELAAASAVAISGTASVSGDIGIGTSFNLAADPIVVSGVIGVAGNVAASTSTGASAAEVWNYVLSNGKTAEENVVEIHAMLSALTPAAISADLLGTIVS